MADALIFASRFEIPESAPADGEWAPTEGGELTVEVGGATARVFVEPGEREGKAMTAITVRFKDAEGSEPYTRLCGGYSVGHALKPGHGMATGILLEMSAGVGARLFFAAGGDARVVTVAADRSAACAVASPDEALDPE